MKILKNISLHFSGIILGNTATTLSFLALYWLLVKIIGSIPFIANLISYPVDFSWYATIGVIGGSAFIGMALCTALCKISKTKEF